MECSLGMVIGIDLNGERLFVLILILMECSLGVFTTIVEGKEVCGLNPYSNGMLTWFY